jgi:serine/threonine protein kinase
MSRYNRNLKPGAKIGQWILIKELGKGGNGSVWKASDVDGKEVAVKILLVQRKDSYVYKRFVSEIRLLESLGAHPGILPILDSYLPEAPSPEAQLASLCRLRRR